MNGALMITKDIDSVVSFVPTNSIVGSRSEESDRLR